MVSINHWVYIPGDMSKVAVAVIVSVMLLLCSACDTNTNSGLAEIDSTETPDIVTIEVSETDSVSAVTVEPSIAILVKILPKQ